MKNDGDPFAGEFLLSDVVKLYTLGRMSSGRAAELAGMTRVEFLLALTRYQIFPLEEEPKELESRGD